MSPIAYVLIAAAFALAILSIVFVIGAGLERPGGRVRRLWRASIWHPDAIPPDEWKYRNLKRVWLPLYDVIALFAGVQAIAFGSTMLNRLFTPTMVDVLGASLVAAAAVCTIGVAFPALWKLEIAGNVALVALIAGYVTMILAFARPPGPSLFVVGMLTFGLPLAFFQLSLLGEEIKERRNA